jgi:hypothetical protein
LILENSPTAPAILHDSKYYLNYLYRMYCPYLTSPRQNFVFYKIKIARLHVKCNLAIIDLIIFRPMALRPFLLEGLPKYSIVTLLFGIKVVNSCLKNINFRCFYDLMLYALSLLNKLLSVCAFTKQIHFLVSDPAGISHTMPTANQ